MYLLSCFKSKIEKFEGVSDRIGLLQIEKKLENNFNIDPSICPDLDSY